MFKKHNISITILLILPIILSIVTAMDKNDPVLNEIDEINTILIRAAIDNDIDIQYKYFDDDVIIMPNFAEPIIGRKAWKKQASEAYEQGRKTLSQSYTITDIIVNDEVIIEVGSYGISMISPNISHPIADYGSYITTWMRQKDGSLKITHVIWNTDQSFNSWHEQIY